MKWLANLFSGGLVKTVENVALEAIQTDTEKAEAKALWIKTLDPNGIMRRQLSEFACKAYGSYLAVALILITIRAFGLGDAAGADEALTAIKELFMPITTSWGVIVSASFGVNATNSVKGR